MAVVAPPVGEVRRFLNTHHAAPVEDLEPLGGGFWSSAWGYRIGDRRLVLRVSDDDEGFGIDRSAMRFAEHGLPVPEVHEVGKALGGAFAISQRCEGRFLESVEPHESEQAGPVLLGLLHALRSVPSSPTDPVFWYEPRPPHVTWRDWLVAGLTDDPAHRVSGWRSTIAGDAPLDRLFRACEVRIGGLLEACPERRDLVHGDLLHGNVLVSPDASEVTAVFSWKCSVRGDFLYDLAWCTFWSPWHPGIAAVDLWSRWRDSDRDAAGAVDAAARHHCYELQIGASHLGWYVWTSDDANLRDAARHLGALLDRGPLA